MSGGGREPRSRQWHWATPESQAALATRDVSTILRHYRALHGLSQTGLGTLLGYDRRTSACWSLGSAP
ncbi:hypothetical protein [Actinacidiphila sp. ITFR-21]|uniref:hypothetical protein n=1 Tax=Actinacidiphila sp. ITFR-21 TaxID=3075199 RepID=UPI0028890592|nr:hypothetical protein [Streptomyces sp. ITFR-21]WNI18058.1 hypothetical protein RLT57_22575 [Streptomyces sp. ITFR-21]